ncbi:hypothetical protein PISMIDRAFT_594309 [Pisolithus microcarpus 441]|uniref:Uncharacterized protein n=1 Tax=Pisolithus microcarpus 441 TaxID=765257 RepID=A0A0C9Y9G1_9AGAM|nr:hypothetical protein PISMIDRAFT_594309 [Pisolithus microcarpus 441]
MLCGVIISCLSSIGVRPSTQVDSVAYERLPTDDTIFSRLQMRYAASWIEPPHQIGEIVVHRVAGLSRSPTYVDRDKYEEAEGNVV